MSQEKGKEQDELSNIPAVQAIGNVPITIRVELGRQRLKVRDVLNLTEGKVIMLNKMAGESLDIRMNDHLFAMGEVVTVNDHFGARVTDILPNERISDDL